MKTVTLDIQDNRYSFFMELVRSLDFVKNVSTVGEADLTDEQILSGIKQAVEEVKLLKAGKLTPKPIKELLDEL